MKYEENDRQMFLFNNKNGIYFFFHIMNVDYLILTFTNIFKSYRELTVFTTKLS